MNTSLSYAVKALTSLLMYPSIHAGLNIVMTQNNNDNEFPFYAFLLFLKTTSATFIQIHSMNKPILTPDINKNNETILTALKSAMLCVSPSRMLLN